MIVHDEVGREYCIHFRFEDVITKDPYGNGVTLPGTICEMHVMVPGSLKARGETACSPSDDFIPVIGRKHALSAVLDAAKIAEPARKAIWEEFFQRYPAARMPHRLLRDAKAKRDQAQKLKLLSSLRKEIIESGEESVQQIDTVLQIMQNKEIKGATNNPL